MCVQAVILCVILTRLMCSCSFVSSSSVFVGGSFVCRGAGIACWLERWTQD